MTRAARLLAALRRNLLAAIPTALGIVILNFFLLQLAPGDAADVLAAESGAATEETMRQLRTQLGLDLPLLSQLLAYLGHLSQGSLGFSPRYNMPVAELILQRLPGTLMLMGFALGMAFVLGLLFGTVMALNAGRFVDRALSVVTLIFYSVPGFWIGLMLIVAFSIKLGWLPSGGSETIASGKTGFDYALDRLRHMILPGTTLALFFIAVYARLTRAAVMEVAQQDFVRTARAMGLSRARVLYGYAFRNAFLPVLTTIGMVFSFMLGANVLVEKVFAWPGIGSFAIESLVASDYAPVQGFVLTMAILYVALNLVIDLLYLAIDPRVSVAG